MKFRTKLYLGNGAIMMLMILIAIIVYFSINLLIDTSRWVEHTHEVIGNGKNLEKYLVDMETGERGFLIAGKEEFLEPYIVGKIKFESLMTETKQLVSDNPAQVERLEKIDEHVKEWIKKAAKPEIAMRREMNKNTVTIDDVTALIEEKTGKRIVDNIRYEFDQFITTEKQLLLERKIEAGTLDARAVKWVEHTYEVIVNAKDLQKYLVDMETGERGFLITGKEEFLEPYSQGRIKFELLMAETKQLISDNPDQIERLEKIDEHVKEWVKKAARPEIAMRREMNKNTVTIKDVSSLIEAGTGKNILDGLRANFDEFISIEKELLHEREKIAKDTAVRAIYVTIFGTILAVFLGGVISVLITRQLMLDITERKRVTEELVQLIDTANAPIFGIDTQGRVNEWNQTTAKITGYKKDDVMGQDLVQDFIMDEYREPVKQVLDNALKGVETTNYEFPLNTKDGKRLEILLNATARRDMEGNIIGVIGIGQDITELREKETILHQAQKMEAVGQLTGGIAHDFNNLLSIISGNLRFLKQDIGETSVEINELFEDAMSAADDGAELTQRLLAFSRNRALLAEDKNINEIIEKFVRFLSRTIGESIELIIDLPDERLYIYVDPSQFENALLNLTLNARDAITQGGNISISATRYHHSDGDESSVTLSEGDYIEVSVTDTGSGIISEDLQHVYEPFYTTKEVGKGSGLGLSMVYGFTQQSGGACHIKSTPGEGTTVFMYFPEIPESKRIEKAKVVDEPAMRGSEVILVVEDEPRVRRVALRDLEKLGYKTLEAENADLAKTIIESGEPIDLLFSDILMPGEMNGHMLAIWVEENHPQIKVVLTSGYSKGQADANRDQAHPFPLVRKPYSINKLAKQIRTTLTG